MPKVWQIFSNKLFIKNHVKMMHPSGRKRVVQVMQEIENDSVIPEGNQGANKRTVKKSVDHDYKEGEIIAIDSTKHDLQINKPKTRGSNGREKSGVKNSHPWE